MLYIMAGFTKRVALVILFNHLFQVNKCLEVCAMWLKYRLALQTDDFVPLDIWTDYQRLSYESNVKARKASICHRLGIELIGSWFKIPVGAARFWTTIPLIKRFNIHHKLRKSVKNTTGVERKKLGEFSPTISEFVNRELSAVLG